MGNSAGKITAPVNTDDVSTVIGVASHDVATLCSSTKNNKWSKHKPVRGESPADYAVWNDQTGNVRGVVGYPIIWGMRLPFNTKEQLSMTNTTISQWLRPLAVRAAHVLNDQAKCANVKNYEYMLPVVGTDFCRLGDYVGYNHNAPEAWTCGARGATAIPSVSEWNGSPGMLLIVDSFDTAEISFYIGMPSNADISFKDLYTGDYRFIVELYDSDPTTFQADGTAPKAVLVCMTKIADMTFGADFSVTVQWLKTIFTTVTNGETTFRAILGVVRFGNTPTLTELKRETGNKGGLGCALLSDADKSKIVTGSGSIPPWESSYKPFLCQIRMQSYSKVEIQVLKYARIIPTTDPYKDLPTSADQSYGSDGFRLQVTVKNKGTSTITLNGANTASGVQPPIFQIQATGAFDTDDPSYSATCLSPVEGKWHDVMIFKDAACQTDSGTITIDSNASATAYFRCEKVMPIGRTSGFTFRVSTDKGATWVITGRFSGAFLVLR